MSKFKTLTRADIMERLESLCRQGRARWPDMAHFELTGELVGTAASALVGSTDPFTPTTPTNANMIRKDAEWNFGGDR